MLRPIQDVFNKAQYISIKEDFFYHQLNDDLEKKKDISPGSLSLDPQLRQCNPRLQNFKVMVAGNGKCDVIKEVLITDNKEDFNNMERDRLG